MTFLPNKSKPVSASLCLSDTHTHTLIFVTWTEREFCRGITVEEKCLENYHTQTLLQLIFSQFHGKGHKEQFICACCKQLQMHMKGNMGRGGNKNVKSCAVKKQTNIFAVCNERRTN